MAEFSDELSLLYFILLNAAVFGSAYFFCRRIVTSSRSQALLDAALLGYGVQYVSVGLPGMLGRLWPAVVCGFALASSFGLIVAARFKRTETIAGQISRRDRVLITAIILFVASFILTYAYSQADLPVMSNDALTYQFPAAVQWLQHGRIDVFNTWFFNPANAYSPLAGSIFVVWMMVPFGSDVMARFVEVPALLYVLLAMYRLCREIGVRPIIAAMTAAAAVLARPIFLPSMMAKDDLFVAFFFIATLAAVSPQRAAERWGAARLGLAFGLLLATKYTALLSVPILLLAIDGPVQAGWMKRKWVLAASAATAIAGPWYLRNVLQRGNPLFPMDVSLFGVHLFHGLFTTAHSQAFGSIASAGRVLIGGSFGLPTIITIVIVGAWVVACFQNGNVGSEVHRRAGFFGQHTRLFGIPQNRRYRTLHRVCLIGPVLGVAIFFWKSPFPEVRFVLPVFLLLFACAAIVLELLCRKNNALTVAAGVLLVGLSAATIFFDAQQAMAVLAVPVVLITLSGTFIAWAVPAWTVARGSMLAAAIALIVLVLAFINWTAYCNRYRASLQGENGGYNIAYPEMKSLWTFVAGQVPNDATIAYTNTYLIYPYEAISPKRRLFYVPVRNGISSLADLHWLGEHLAGEDIVPAAVQATNAAADQEVWLKNLRDSGANYLLIGKSAVLAYPPEIDFAKLDPQHFQPLFAGDAGWVFAVK